MSEGRVRLEMEISCHDNSIDIRIGVHMHGSIGSIQEYSLRGGTNIGMSVDMNCRRFTNMSAIG